MIDYFLNKITIIKINVKKLIYSKFQYKFEKYNNNIIGKIIQNTFKIKIYK